MEASPETVATDDQAVKPLDRVHLQRRHDWPVQLSTFISERRSLPYVYGRNDCGCFVLDAIEALTGANLLPNAVRPTTAIGAHRFLLANGYGDVEGLMAALLGAPLLTPKLAQRGDVVSFESSDERHLAIVAGVSAVTPGRDGMLWVPRSLWCIGWKVG